MWLLLVALCLFVSLPIASAGKADWSAWQGILHDHVRPGMKHDIKLALVDYTTIRSDPRWLQLLQNT